MPQSSGQITLLFVSPTYALQMLMRRSGLSPAMTRWRCAMLPRMEKTAKPAMKEVKQLM